MENYLCKTFATSIPLNKHSDNTLKLFVYGNAFLEFTKLQYEYEIVNIEEHFYNNIMANTRSIQIILTLRKKEKFD